MVNWREPTTTQRWDIQGVRVGEGNKYSVRVGECEEYKYLGVVMRLRGRIFKGMEVRRLENMRKQNNRVQGFCRNTLTKHFVPEWHGRGWCYRAFFMEWRWCRAAYPGRQKIGRSGQKNRKIGQKIGRFRVQYRKKNRKVF